MRISDDSINRLKSFLQKDSAQKIMASFMVGLGIMEISVAEFPSVEENPQLKSEIKTLEHLIALSICFEDLAQDIPQAGSEQDEPLFESIRSIAKLCDHRPSWQRRLHNATKHLSELEEVGYSESTYEINPFNQSGFAHHQNLRAIYEERLSIKKSLDKYIENQGDITEIFPSKMYFLNYKMKRVMAARAMLLIINNKQAPYPETLNLHLSGIAEDAELAAIYQKFKKNDASLTQIQSLQQSAYNRLQKIKREYRLPDTLPESLEKALRMAATNNKAQDLLFLLEALKVNVDAADSTSTSKKTALHHAAIKGHPEIIKILLRKNANTALTDANGNTPIMLTKPGTW